MKTIATILILGCAMATLADPAEVDIDATYFHPAASMYIHGDTTSASNLVATGLALFPENGKLLRLKELLEQQQEQDQENQDDQQQNQNQDQQENQDQQNDQEQPPDQDENNPENQPEQPPPEPQSAEQMSADEAEQLLDAMRQEEQNKRMQLHPVFGAPVKVDKDW